MKIIKKDYKRKLVKDLSEQDKEGEATVWW